MEEKYKRARNLRKASTEQERIIWGLVRNRQLNGLKFVRQYPIGKYIADFACRRLKLVIELDGGQHNEDDNINYDNERTKYMEAEGYRVIRFWNNEIDNNLEGVYERLLEIISEMNN